MDHADLQIGAVAHHAPQSVGQVDKIRRGKPGMLVMLPGDGRNMVLGNPGIGRHQVIHQGVDGEFGILLIFQVQGFHDGVGLESGLQAVFVFGADSGEGQGVGVLHNTLEGNLVAASSCTLLLKSTYSMCFCGYACA